VLQHNACSAAQEMCWTLRSSGCQTRPGASLLSCDHSCLRRYHGATAHAIVVVWRAVACSAVSLCVSEFGRARRMCLLHRCMPVKVVINTAAQTICSCHARRRCSTRRAVCAYGVPANAVTAPSTAASARLLALQNHLDASCDLPAS